MNDPRLVRRLRKILYVASYDSPQSGIYKIGTTGNLKNRLASLQSGCPLPIALEFAWEGDHKPIMVAEYLILKASNRISGEWIKASSIDDVYNLVETVLAGDLSIKLPRRRDKWL